MNRTLPRIVSFALATAIVAVSARAVAQEVSESSASPSPTSSESVLPMTIVRASPAPTVLDTEVAPSAARRRLRTYDALPQSRPRTHANRGLIGAGAAVFGLGYGAMLFGVSAAPWLAFPIVPPFVLAGMVANHTSGIPVIDFIGGVIVFVLVFDGLVQVLGGALIIAGFVDRARDIEPGPTSERRRRAGPQWLALAPAGPGGAVVPVLLAW